MKSFLIITTMLMTVGIAGRAQRQDTLATLKLFMKVCNGYQTLPMQVDLDIRNTANIVISSEDTSHLQARFVARKEGTYITMGDMEQIVNDSLLLLVSANLKKMLLYSNHRSVTEQLQLSSSLQLKDASMKKMAERYQATVRAVAKDTAEIVLLSRTAVHFAELPTEMVRVRYDPRSLQPYEVFHTKRSIVRVSEAEYRMFEKQLDRLMLAHPDSSFYVVRERLSDYRYDRIAHIPDVSLPATVDDRITRDAAGDYKPAARFESYSVTREN